MTQQQNEQPLAKPFAQIFVDRAEAGWALDFLQHTVKQLGLSGAYDERFALTLVRRAGKPELHLSFGGWLVVGLAGPDSTPHRVELTLLAERVAWDERLAEMPFTRKEGHPEVRSYRLPVQMVRPMTSDLQAAYEATLAFIADKFRHWKRPPSWQRHNPELIQALFDPEQRRRVFAGLLQEPELRYEPHRTTFYQDVSEEPEEYEFDETSPDEHIPRRRYNVNLDPEKIDQMISIVRSWYPNWSGFSDPDFRRDETDYKQASIAKAQELLSQAELEKLIDKKEYDEFINRLDRVGKDNNLLWRSVPSSGDLNILYDSNLDAQSFCEAFLDLVYGNDDSPLRLERYVNYVQANNLPNKWTFPTYFLFICHPATEIFVKPRTIRWFLSFFDKLDEYTPKPTAAAYSIIRTMALYLKDELEKYEPRDMVDIQSLIWVCRPEKQAGGEEDSDDEAELVLAEPFSQIFVDREEAEWAFDFLREAFNRLGIESPEDARFALTLPGNKLLRLNFGIWAILSFYGPNNPACRVHLTFITDQIKNTEGYYSRKWASFAHKSNEPEISGYDLPIEVVKPLQGDLLEAYEKALDYIAEKFCDQERCPWRSKHHVAVIAEALFDRAKQKELFDEGLDSETLTTSESVSEQDTIEIIEPKTQLSPPYPLSQLAEDTGLDETDLARWVRAIERKGQAIFYGPPGTGKTFVARKLARHLVGGGDGFVELVQFHPAYAYEDFIQGIRPRSEGGHLSYPLVPGRFLEFCRRATERRDRCVLILDEINRANLARVFGELMYLLEYRDQDMPLAGGGSLKIPQNVRLIGTMNTADRSIALVDHALRRRFAFLALYPNLALLRHFHDRRQTGFPVENLIGVVQRLNRQINDPHYEVGITFFLQPDLAEQIEDIWRMEIEPYLEEYFFDQPETVDAFRWPQVAGEILPQ